MHTVKVFRSGNSQAIRIPREYAVDDSEMYINKIGKVIVMVPKHDPWSAFRESLDSFSPDVFEHGREQPGLQVRESL
ncbi:MAG TPA: type II toxin-antitoxin system VapB family antitoxin [Spirochaetota bacterium]|nr:type II toxin-antitoxin system VapB family antitoxin [Spirochaetota bacterium]HPH02402.1 type II toxin-antitoxin system VapB family antitoxin [Spirochaetota bacterium]